MIDRRTCSHNHAEHDTRYITGMILRNINSGEFPLLYSTTINSQLANFNCKHHHHLVIRYCLFQTQQQVRQLPYQQPTCLSLVSSALPASKVVRQAGLVLDATVATAEPTVNNDASHSLAAIQDSTGVNHGSTEESQKFGT